MRLASCLIALIVLASYAHAQPAVSTDPRKGPPTDKITISGSGFGASELIDIYFGTTDVALARTGSGGAFSRPLRIPKSAVPGKHTISAVGRQSGDSAQVRFLVQTDWRQFQHGPRHAGYNPRENVLNARNVAKLQLLWSKSGVASTGDFPTPPPVVADGLLFTVSEQGLIYALDAKTGAQIWTANPDSWSIASPAYADGVLYVGTLGTVHDDIFAYDGATGSLKWSAGPGGQYYVDASAPAVSNGILYVAEALQDDAGLPGELCAYNAATGELVWTQPIDAFYAPPVVANGTVYVDDLVAIDSSTGQTLWGKFPLAIAEPVVPVAGNGAVYESAFGHPLTAYDALSGNPLWTAANLYTPAVAAGVLYAPGNGGMNALDAATGAVLWTTKVAGVGMFTPVVGNGVVYATATNNRVYAFDARTGKQLWSAAATGESLVSDPSLPVLVDGMLYVASANQSVDAFGLPPGSAEAQAAQPPPPPDPAALRPDLTLQLEGAK